MADEKNLIKHGVVVRLRSGGPIMTVSGIRPKEGVDLTCHWFVGDELRTVVLSREELEVVPAEEVPCGTALEREVPS